MTRREAIQTYRGNFYKHLLHAYDKGGAFELCRAYTIADPDHQAVLREHFPNIDIVTNALVSHWPMNLPTRIEQAFPGLKALDEETDEPTTFDLLDEVAVVAEAGAPS